MAAAEARAVWQRAANRCFVQEDAKRAPKLACCQSSSPSSKQTDGGQTGAADVLDHPAAGFMPPNCNPSYTNLPPDARWWLQLQPSYGYQKGLTYEQLNAMEAEIEMLEAEILNSTSKVSDKDSTCIDSEKNSEPSFDDHGRVSAASYSKEYPEVTKQEVKSLYDGYLPEFTDPNCTKDHLVMDKAGCPNSQKSNDYCFDPETPCIVSDKNVPWWRTADKDDLASLVAQKSFEYIENCDLPPPQKVHVKRYPCACSGSSHQSDMQALSLDLKVQGSDISSSIVHVQGCPNCERVGVQMPSTEGDSQSGSGKSVSDTVTEKDSIRNGQVSEKDHCKAQILEALCHSQTRAREAEKKAKQACAEKDDLIKLVFRQASQLFAYKQWFQLLQLETLYHQIKNSDHTMSTLFPVTLPWIPQKVGRLRKNTQKYVGKRGKRCRPKHSMGKYAVVFALGLSLVGAGLLLGWTIGWMLPF